LLAVSLEYVLLDWLALFLPFLLVDLPSYWWCYPLLTTYFGVAKAAT
jgi:hypothetical protein